MKTPPPLTDYSILFNSIVLVKSLPDGEADTSTIIKEFIEGNENYSPDNHPIFHYAAHSADGFRNLINEQLIRHAQNGMRPLLNLDCHGSPDDGLVFEDGSEIGWLELADLFASLNEASEFNLTLLLSCCYGASFVDGVEITKPAPCAFLIAPTHEIDGAEILSGLRLFYSHLFKTMNIFAAIEEARKRELEFGFWDAEFALTWYTSVVSGYLKHYCTLKEGRRRVEDIFQRHKAEGNSERYGRRSMTGIKKALAKANRERLVTSDFDRYFMLDKIPANRPKFETIRQRIELQILELKATGKYLL